VTAARDLPLDTEALDVATRHYALVRDDERAPTSSALVFRIGREWLALPTSVFDRVTDVPAVHSLPHRRGGTTVGLVTVGGDLVVHLSLAGLLGIDGDAQPEARGSSRPAVARLVVLVDMHGKLAITANEVWGVVDYEAEQLRPVPSTLARALVSYTTAMLAVDGKQVGCLDGARVMGALSNALT
jgi:chemotaxis-related protein WspD